MKLRYLESKKEIGNFSRFNVVAMSEIDVGDDSVFIKDLECWVESKQAWMPLSEAFAQSLVIVDNYNTYFREPKNEEEKSRGYY